MEHDKLIRIICKDGLTLVGGYDEDHSNKYKISLIGHLRHVWRRNIHEAFVQNSGIWSRTMCNTSVYDAYIKTGGQLWPGPVLEAIYSSDLS